MKNVSIVGGFLVVVIIGAGVYYLPKAKYLFTPPQKTSPTVFPVVPIVNPFGVVTAKTSNSLTISGVGGKILLVHITAQTQYWIGTSTTNAKVAPTIAIGSLVSIASSTPNQDGSLTAAIVQVIPPPPPDSAQ